MSSGCKHYSVFSGINECKSDQICRPFTEVFPNGAYMCENIYPGDYKVTDDSKPAMVLWFDGETNPNDEVRVLKPLGTFRIRTFFHIQLIIKYI